MTERTVINAQASCLLAEANNDGQRAINLARRTITDILQQAEVVRAIAVITTGSSIDLRHS
jgi:hypothetical protein